MSETFIKAPERINNSRSELPEPKVLTDDHGMGRLQLSEVRQLNFQFSKNSGWEPVTGENAPGNVSREKISLEKSPAKNAPDSESRDGMVGIPEEAPAFKAYERLHPKIESQFPGDDEKNQELKRAAFDYLMNKEGFGSKPTPEQLELLKGTHGALDRLDKIYFDDMFPNHLSMGNLSELYKKN